uniref:Uncharacterized protein n=1 Tax=Magnetococcus massalia (strain MO-1) TaxID=451514 RepID=A0A1S7LFN0_MAGMO|nr:Conserved protein of unknown function. Containing MscS Mechanosensitive ion channel domain [Candidatus Magnetococcus massalia]
MAFLKKIVLTNQQKLIALIVLMLAIVAGAWFSLNHLFLDETVREPLTVAVVAPMSGEAKGVGRSIVRATKLFVKQFREQGGVQNRHIKVKVLDDKNSMEGAIIAARAIASENKAAFVIGHWSPESLEAALPIYNKAKIPLLTLSSAGQESWEKEGKLYRMTPVARNQAKFLANYVRNVLGQKVITIVHEDSPYGVDLAEGFTEIFKRFGTKIHYTIEAKLEAGKPRLEEIATELKEKRDAGTVFIAMPAPRAAFLLKKMRDAKVRHPVIGIDALATDGFRDELARLPGSMPHVADYTNRLLLTAPLIFDTASEAAQDFLSNYKEAFRAKPDWVAAYAYEGSRVMLGALAKGLKGRMSDDVGDIALDRRIVNYVFEYGGVQEILERGRVTGPNIFARDEAVPKPISMGQYNGDSLVSALTQLQPIDRSIRQSGTTNYLEELKKGRMLFVNDQFMFKVNVVYVGVKLNEVVEIDPGKGTAKLDMDIWFRYRGKFDPATVVFENSTTDEVLLKTPDTTMVKDNLNFKLYKVVADFNLDFNNAKRAYGDRLLGISFRHKHLNRNNLKFVVDVLGLGVKEGETFLQSIDTPTTFNPSLNWEMNQAWISQEPELISTLGKPTYVGYGVEEPIFSRMNLGIVVRKSQFNVRDFITEQKFFYFLTVLGVVGLLVAALIDVKDRGFFWRTVSWVLRVIFWPITLLAAGNLILDLAFQTLSTYYIDSIVLVYQSLWWIIPAMLVSMALTRFLWDPLEARTERKIPNVIRILMALLIYVFATLGIVAFVLDQTLTSILATSGLLTMIIGLAIQSNIANVFSGIVINVERPFSIGDWLKLGDMDDAQLVDITWRTMRLRTKEGLTISLPNGRASEMTIVNYSADTYEQVVIPLRLCPSLDPDETIKLIIRTLECFPRRVKEKQPTSEFNGVVYDRGNFYGIYEAEFWIDDHTYIQEITSDLWIHFWKVFKEADVDLEPVPKQFRGKKKKDPPPGKVSVRKTLWHRGRRKLIGV